MEIQKYADQYLENRLNNTELNITMYIAVYHLIEYLTKSSYNIIFYKYNFNFQGRPRLNNKMTASGISEIL